MIRPASRENTRLLLLHKAMAQNHVGVNNHSPYEDEMEEEEEAEGDLTLFYFESLFRRDTNERATFLNNFSKSIKKWIARPDEPAAQRLLQAHLPTALRLSINSPFEDIRDAMKRLLDELEQQNVKTPRSVFTGPSTFIPKADTVTTDNPSEAMRKDLAQVQLLYEETFLNEGRLSNIVQLLGYHPTYLNLFIKTHDYLMRGNGPLPLDIRSYIAILAASRHKCSYLVTVLEAEFLKNDGDPQWLKGLQYVPPKVINLLTINKMLAHQPWFVKPSHMKDLVTGVDSWSISELVHAIVIMAHYHALAGFALGCGVNPEIDTPLGHTGMGKDGEVQLIKIPFCSNPALGVGSSTPGQSDSESEPLSPVTRSPTHPAVSESLVQHYIETSTAVNENGSTENGPQWSLLDSLTEKLKTMENEDSPSDEESDEQNNLIFTETASSAGMVSQKTKAPVPTPVSLVRYLEDAEFEHEDFTLSSAITLRARDYSWEDHGFPYINRLYPDIGPLLDDKFRLAFQMTYRMCGSEKNVDTSPFRQAIWYYIHSIKGIRHDDYHYRRVNQVLDITFKTYIRMVACFPERVTNFDFRHNTQDLGYSEIVHVNILALEARLQAELIYALRAIMMHMK